MQQGLTQQSPQQQTIQANGTELVVYEWGTEYRGQDSSIVLAHATGFHGRCWSEVVSYLGERHVIALDQRGHGQSDKRWFDSWQCFGLDLQYCLQELGVKQAIGVGHSMGGHATVIAAANQPELFARLVLVDPVILPPTFYHQPLEILEQQVQDGHPAERRRSQFESAAEMVERFAERLPFSLFTEQALRDYCEYGLLPAEQGEGYQLACSPKYEAAIYSSVLSHPEIYQSVEAITQPVTLLRAIEARTQEEWADFRFSPTFPELVAGFSNARDVYLPELTHFMPMQEPGKIAELILQG